MVSATYDISGELAAALLAAAPDAVFVVDVSGKITLATGQVGSLFGYEPGELVGEAIEILVPEGVRRDHERYREGFPSTHNFRPMGTGLELRGRRKDGSEFPADISLVVTELSDQGPAVIAFVRDVSERARAEALRQTADRLARLNLLKTTLLHAVSHDLRGPLTSVLGSAQTIDDAGGSLSEENTRALVGAVVRGATKMQRLVSGLLDMDRLERGVVAPNRQPCDLGALIRDTADAIEFPRKVEVQADGIVASVDPVQFGRIVENLIVNADKHTPVGGTIWIGAERVGDEVLIRVDDEGPGVPPELREAIFEEYRRGDDSGAAGLGIGLSLVAGFAGLHGGRAWVEDRPGGGASFRVLLPG